MAATEDDTGSGSSGIKVTMVDTERQKIRDELLAKGKDLPGVGTALDVLEQVQGYITVSQGAGVVRYGTGANS